MEKSLITPNSELRAKYIPCQSSRKDQTYDAYIQLLKSHGIQINPKCFPSYFKLKNGLQYPGMATSHIIEANEVLVRVPKKLVLSSYDASQRPQLQDIFKQKFYHVDWAWEDRLLTTYLLYIYSIEQTENIWFHLVQNLPKDIDILGFWPQQDLQKFKDLTVKSAAQKDLQSFEQQWSEFKQVQKKHKILQHQKFSRQNYRWIFIHLVSRCFGKQLSFTSMVPFCQLFNHHVVDGYYDVETLTQQEENDERNSQTDSITTDGSYLSEEYVQIGEYAYQQIQTKHFTWQCKEHLDLNEEQKKSIVSLSNDILTFLDDKLNLEDFSILFVPRLIERTKLIETQYRAGRKPYKRAFDQLKIIQSSAMMYKQKIIQNGPKWRGKTFTYKTQQQKRQETNKKTEQKLSSEKGFIEFPKQESKPYDNFLLLTGKRDSYQPNNQVYFCYGRNSNRTLLLRYGFAIEGNKYEHVWLSFDLVNSLANYPDTVKKLQEKHLSLRRKFKLKINKLNIELIMFFRLNSWSYYGKDSVQQLFKIKDYGKQIAILEQLKDALNFRYEQFEGTNDLQDPSLTYHQYFINVYHHEKEKIIRQHMEFMRTLIKFLNELDKGVDLQKAKQQFSPQEKFIFRHYLTQF